MRKDNEKFKNEIKFSMPKLSQKQLKRKATQQLELGVLTGRPHNALSPIRNTSIGILSSKEDSIKSSPKIFNKDLDDVTLDGLLSLDSSIE